MLQLGATTFNFQLCLIFLMKITKCLIRCFSLSVSSSFNLLFNAFYLRAISVKEVYFTV